MAKKAVEATDYSNVDASPVKSFFVRMLTRDISLTDSILDLLDNCVDGVLRKKKRLQGEHPYKGFHADIKFDEDTFEISDNCGGIPWDLHDYAFRMGRPHGRQDKRKGAVGTYGIGMKRAIFKIGQQCLISTQSGEHAYEVELSKAWINDESEWHIPARSAKHSMAEDGTTIVIGELHPNISRHFGHDYMSFTKDLIKKIESHYAIIIAKGFQVKVNGKEMKAKPTSLVFVEDGKKNLIRPYIFTSKEQGVEIFLAVGFARPIPSQDDVLTEQDNPSSKYSSMDAGWTVVCNDRVVLYCDKTILTGWGEAGVPQYHPQFIAISGLVEFRSDDASKLPTTTTKRGIEAQSTLYLEVKNRMREGMKLFTDYTNKWKRNAAESKEHLAKGKPLSFSELKERTRNLTMTVAKRGIQGQLYKPTLPTPPVKSSQSGQITFVRKLHEIRAVSDHLFGSDDVAPNRVGEECFGKVLKETKT